MSRMESLNNGKMLYLMHRILLTPTHTWTRARALVRQALRNIQYAHYTYSLLLSFFYSFIDLQSAARRNTFECVHGQWDQGHNHYKYFVRTNVASYKKKHLLLLRLLLFVNNNNINSVMTHSILRETQKEIRTIQQQHLYLHFLLVSIICRTPSF